MLAAELDYKPQTAEQLSEAVTLPVNLVEARLREEPDRFTHDGHHWRLKT